MHYINLRFTYLLTYSVPTEHVGLYPMDLY